jgi:hypothetical protein
MGKKMKIARNNLLHGEKGLILPLVMVLLLLVDVLIPPLMGYVSQSARSQQSKSGSSGDLYAADAGVEDALWQIKYNHLDDTFPAYNLYNYTATWSYYLTTPVNDKDVNVTISNVWIPMNITAPSPSQAQTIIDDQRLVVAGNTVGASTGTGNNTYIYQINLTYYPKAGENLNVTRIGVWLPPGFTYYSNSTYKSSLEDNATAPYYKVPRVIDWAGDQNGTAIWDYSPPVSSPVAFSSFPGVNPSEYPRVTTIRFRYKDEKGKGEHPRAVAWMETSGVSDLTYAWDADQKVYRIDTVAGSISVQAYTVKTETRELGAATNGDYVATGNSLMIDTPPIDTTYGIRDTLLTESSSTVSAIPSTADVSAAYLYWSAWLNSSLFLDSCSDINTNWRKEGSGSWDWAVSSGTFRGHHSSGGNDQRYFTMKNKVNLSGLTPGSVTINWQQWESGTLEPDDALQFEFSKDDGAHWDGLITAFAGEIGSARVNFYYVVPEEYLNTEFRMRFYLKGFADSGEYCYIDNIAVPQGDIRVKFKIDGNTTYFDANGVPTKGNQEIVADTTQVLRNYDDVGSPNGFSYACYKDVTALVRTFCKATNGNATYTVNGVAGNTGNQWSYAGWSLVIIYTSPETEGHQLYLYDKFLYAHNNTDLDFDNDGKYGATITGFIVPEMIPGEVNAAGITCFIGEGDVVWPGDFLALNAPSNYWGTPTSNPWSIPQTYKLWDGTTSTGNSSSNSNNVWNGKSVGMSADGVDIDTFHVTWTSGLLHQSDSSAHIDIPTTDDSFNVVYIILSFRSKTTSGGTISYLIRRSE